MLTLYFSPGSSAMATHIALHEIGVAFEAKPLSFTKREQHAPDYLAINPEGKVPTLLIDGRPLTEVAATLYVSCQALSRGEAVAGGRHRSRGAGDFVDVVYRRHHSPGPPHRHRTLERGVQDRRSEAGRQRMDGRQPIFDRRHPPVSALLAVQDHDLAGTRRISEPRRPFRADRDATGGQKDDRDRERHWLQPALAHADEAVPQFVSHLKMLH